LKVSQKQHLSILVRIPPLKKTLGGDRHDAHNLSKGASGTTRMTVQSLHAMWDAPIFPELDAAQCCLSTCVCAELAGSKGHMTQGLMQQYMGRKAS
jgi:hypothetical protein